MDSFNWFALAVAAACLVAMLVQDRRAEAKTRRIRRRQAEAFRLARRLDHLHMVDGDRGTT